ncbi:protein of unknown function [Chitinophaga sp. YR573]|uniref:DUF4252 domain-containing protein n=1 Tax=Chitinophaga sp. YR573 TaxID=1881040 RepID=UPI0008C98B77|nr:DUF4252 domain-containing protein [Chitinophaga sp. YR573]SEW38351.1 protein of unknown function [Chitinophaga sp. YR573]
MRYCSIILVLFFLAAGPAMGQRKCLRQFYHEHKRGQHAETFKIGLGRLTMKFANLFIPANLMEEDGIPFKRLFSSVHRMKLYAISGTGPDSTVETASIQRLKQRLIDRYKFEPLVEVRHEGSIVHLLNKGNEDNVGDLIVLVQDAHDFVILDLRTSLKISDINQLVRQLAKN